MGSFPKRNPPLFQVAFNDTGDPFRELSDQNYQRLALVKWDGAGVVGNPRTIEAVADQLTSDMISLKVYDLTNAQVIAEVTGATTTGPEIVDLGELLNVSAGPAVWEIQGKRGASNVGRLYSLSVT